ncbi:hypothetical protein Goarm_016927 [Gossypium armourianum]|uniref:Protein kinase domain-containing protein n=1 Tax=Gossypium armourianum TaxID=34283 RepID=A0A7J9JDQ5_9ROSI|nr:hypothetical protein [Gossypium armourianum]
MEKLLFLYLLLPLFLTLQFYPVPILSHPYNFPDKFLINCGSGSSLPQSGNRKFVGDKNPNSFSVGISKSVQDTNQSTTELSLYKTARFYRRPFSYEFDITDKGRHAFRNITSFPLIKDFLVPINSASFRIHFSPAFRTSFAFVNAIEVFRVPNLKDNRIHVTSTGNKGPFKGLTFQVLRTVMRVNFGGQSISDQSAVASVWLADDDYIFIGNSSKKCTYLQNGKVNYVDEEIPNENFTLASENLVPKAVYMSCRKVILNDGQASNSTNITWHFKVSKNARHLVRAHFCDIIAPGVNTVYFSLFIYCKYKQEISPNEDSGFTAIPFYYDFVVDSGDSDFIGISVVLGEELATDKYAYLSGLEIMEFIKEPGLELEIRQPKGKRAIFIITGSIVGFLVICGLHKFCQSPPVPNLKMSFAEIVEATKNFEAKLLIGKGGFGKVYRGTLRNGLKVALKRSESKHGQGIPEFQTEVMVLSRIRHRHLVALIGYCNEGPEMILVYEFMEKGNLRDHLYKLHQNLEKSSILSSLTWNQRLEICIGAAEGLHYLHTSSDGGIIHRDVKSTNVLLDEGYVAKVADFGLSKSGLLDPAERSIGVKGSFGYLDPEYFKCLQFTEKSDVYSFGVVLLVVLCARPAILTSQRMEEINLAEWGLSWLKKGELEKIIDPSVAGQININSLRKFSEIVEKCLKPTGANRPTMHDVCWDLKYTLQLQQTAVCREPHEDNAIDPSLDSSSPTFQHLPSNSFPMEKDYVPMEKDDGSATTSSGVFSQLKIDDGR